MTFIGRAVGWYQEGQGTGFIGADLGRYRYPIGVGRHRIKEADTLS